VSRGAAAEFSFFLAIPTMLGAGGLKVCKLMAAGGSLTSTEWGILAVGCLSAFLVSMAAIRFLMDFVRQHSFSAFGWYRIGLGLAILIAFYR
jgi:undecaprenyl-diphosphatase